MHGPMNVTLGSHSESRYFVPLPYPQKVHYCSQSDNSFIHISITTCQFVEARPVPCCPIYTFLSNGSAQNSTYNYSQLQYFAYPVSELLLEFRPILQSMKLSAKIQAYEVATLLHSHPRRPDGSSAFIVPSIQTSDQREEDILYDTRLTETLANSLKHTIMYL